MDDSVIFGLFVFGALAILGFVGLQLFHRTGIPDVLLLLLTGMVLGPILRVVDVRSLDAITPYFGTLALIFILFDSGLELDFGVVLRQILPVLVLVVLSVGTVLFGVAQLLIHCWGWHWLPAYLLGTLLANTSGALVLPVVGRMLLPEDDKATLKLEAAASDVLVILLFVSLMAILQALGNGGRADFDPRATMGKLAGSFSVAIVIGTIAGVSWVVVLNRIQKLQHNYFATLGLLLVLYSLSEYLGASGMMAVLFFGIVLANSQRFGQFFNIPEIHFTTNELRHLHTSFSFFVKTFFLIYIGLFLSMEMFREDFFLMGVAVMGALVLGRVVSALAFSLLFHKPKVTRLAVAAMLPRGLAVAALAMAPGSMVDQVVGQRMERRMKTESALAETRRELEALRAETDKAHQDSNSQTLAGLVQEQVDAGAKAKALSMDLEKDDEALRNLSDVQESTHLFRLFAPLSILVTNILMTLGCLLVQREAQKASPPAKPGP